MYQIDESIETRIHSIGGEWGNHIDWLDGGKSKPVMLEDGTIGQGPRRVYGHMPKKPKIGERLTAKMQSGRTALFVFTEVEYMKDPTDMFLGTLEILRYLD